MNRRREKQFYIIAECELHCWNPSDHWRSGRKPVLLYEDGTLEVQGVPDARFKDYSRHKRWKQCYSDIQTYMDEYINSRDRDVRSYFRPTKMPLYLMRVLKTLIPSYQKSITLSELWKFQYRHQIERQIFEALLRLHHKLTHKDIMLKFAYR